MKRGLWRTIFAATILLICMLAGAACASEAVEAPCPQIQDLNPILVAGEDLTFEFYTDSYPEPGKPVSYEIWLNGGNEPYATPAKEGEVTIPWTALSSCGNEVTITVRVCGDGYIPQEDSGTVRIVTVATGTGPAITFTSMSEDGHYWLNGGAWVWIDATGATELYIKEPFNNTLVPLHNDIKWNEVDGTDEYNWGVNHEHVSYATWLDNPEPYTVKVLAYMPAPTDNDPDAMAWKMSTATLQVEPKGEIPGPAVTITGLDANGCIARGETLGVSVTTTTGRYFDLSIYEADENGEIIEDTLCAYEYSNWSTSYIFPTWEMSGRYVMTVTEGREGYVPGKTNIVFTVVTGENFIQPEEPVWTFSKNSVDTEEPFDVSVYIPADDTQFGTPWSELWIEQDGETIYYKDARGNGCGIPNVTLDNDAPVTFTAYRWYPNGGDVRITYTGQFTVNPATDAPTPKVTGLGITHPIGEDLTFTIGIEESEADKLIAGKPLKYQVQLEGHTYTFTSAGEITVPWEGFVEEYYTSSPGDRVIMYIRAFGQGYNAKMIRKEVILSGEAEEGFRIAFAGTDEEHIRLVVHGKFRLLVQLPQDTTGIDTIEIRIGDHGWGYDHFTPANLPEEGILTGEVGSVTDNVPVLARCTMTDGTYRYSNMLLADYYSLGPLPDLQLETNLTMTDGAYHIRRGDFIRTAVANGQDYAGKGEWTEFRAAILDRTEGYDREIESQDAYFDPFHTEIGLSAWGLEAREEPYYLKATISTRDNVWEDTTVEFPLYVDEDAEMPEGVLITATKTEIETRETVHIQVSAPEARRIEIFRGTKDDYDSEDTYYGTYAYFPMNYEEAGTKYFWARAYYADETTADSDVLEINVTAPHGDLADALTISIPSQVQAHQPFTVRTVSRNTEDPVIPDKLYVQLRPYNQYWGGYEDTAARTDELTVPAKDDEEDWLIEPGQLYSVTVEAYKQGYGTARLYRSVYAPDAEDPNSAVLTVNGETTGAALENGTPYTVGITGLPEGVTCVAIIDVDGSSWSFAYPEEGATSVTKDDISLYTPLEQGEIYALYTTVANPGDYFALEAPWDGCTNIVPVTITCSHGDTRVETEWEYSYFVPDGKEYHRIYCRGENWTYCEWCGKKLGSAGMTQYDGIRDRHTFNSQGECVACEYQCPHDAADVERRWKWDGEYTATANNQYTHHITGTVIDYDLCTNCYAELGNETQRTVDEDEKHHFDYGYYCYTCETGYPDNYLNVDVMDGCQESMSVQPGADVTMGVTAESSLSDELNYQWCWYDAAQDPGNGTYVPIVGATQPTFTLENCMTKKDLYVMVSDGYVHCEQYFHITIDNEFSAYASDATNLYVPLNSTAELRVSAYCREGTLTYQWYYPVYQPEWGYSEYEPIPDTDTPVLTTVPITQTEDYKCRVSDVYGNSTEIWFTVQVNSHLKVTANGGTNASAAPGGETTMSVTATSDYPGQITYQWYREVDEGWGSYYQTVQGATGPSLTVSDVREHRTYRVDVKDGYMEDYLYFSVIVDSQMDAYIDGDTRVTADYGSQVTLSVKATDMFDGAGITYRWLRWRNYPDSYDQYAEELGSEADLEITALDPGVIYCEVRNEYGMMVLDVNLSVDTHLTVEPEANEYKVPYGDPLTLRVNATTLTNAYTCTWSREKTDYSDRQEIPGETGSTLQIDAVTEPMFYFCVVDDGVTTEGVNYILVEPDTQLTAVPASPTAFAVTGEPVTMSVSASSMLGAEAITCRWTRTDRTYGGSEEIDGAYGLSLTVTETGDADYRCYITDGFNETYVFFRTCTQSISFYYNDQSHFDVNYGESVTMGVTAASPEGPAVYRWRRGDTVLEGETGPTLTVTVTENAQYFCDVYFGDSTEPYNTEWFWVRIMDTFENHSTDNRAIWVVPQEGLTLSTDVTSGDGSELTYSWTREGSAIPGGTGSSLDVAYEAECRLVYLTCNVRDVYGNTLQLSFPCLFGTPETIQAGTPVTCTGDEKFVRFTPAVSAVYTMALTGSVYDAGVFPAQSGEDYFQLTHDTAKEVRLQGGKDYYIRLTEDHVLTVALKQEEQEAYAFSLRRNDRILVPALTINGGSYPVANLVSSDPSTVYANGDVIRALKTGQATVTATYLGGAATRTFTITVANGPVLKLPYDLNEIRTDAFAGDTGLCFIELGYNVQNVRSGAFANAGSVTVYVNGYNTVFDDGVFTGSSPAIICRNYSPVAAYCSEKGLLYFCQAD